MSNAIPTGAILQIDGVGNRWALPNDVFDSSVHFLVAAGPEDEAQADWTITFWMEDFNAEASPTFSDIEYILLDSDCKIVAVYEKAQAFAVYADNTLSWKTNLLRSKELDPGTYILGYRLI